MKPVLQALVLAEKVYVLDDERKVICGTFTGITLTRPKTQAESEADGHEVLEGGKAGSPWAYISLTGVCDNTELLLQFVSLKRNQVIFEQKITIRCKNRLAPVELVCGLPHLAVKEAGTYAFDIVCEGEILGTHRIAIAIVDDDESSADQTEASE